MSLSNYLELALLNHVFGASAYSAPATIYVGLSTSDPGEAGTLTGEPNSTGSYARVAVTNNTTNFPSANPKLNGTAITFPESTAAWSSGATALSYFFTNDAATLGAGNVLTSAALTTPRTVNAAGITLSFAINALSHSLD